MNTVSANQKTMKKVLRSRRVNAVVKALVDTEKILKKPASKRRVADTNEEMDDVPEDCSPKQSSHRNEQRDYSTECDAVQPKQSSRKECDTDEPITGDDDCPQPKRLKSSRSEKDLTEKSKIAKLKVSTKPTGKSKRFTHLNGNSEGEELSEPEKSPIASFNEMENDSTESSVPNRCGGLEHQNQDDVEKIIDQNDQLEDEDQENDPHVENWENCDAENDTDTESMSETCLEGVLRGFDKDIGALYSKVNGIESDVKEIKRLLEKRQTQPCTIRTLSSQLKEKSETSLLPKMPLKKKSYVCRMESDAGENEKYKEQMIRKLASFGGKSVQDMMINIFKKLFTPKLKTKYCWRGSKKSGKKKFSGFENIIEIMWMAVKVQFKDCTESMIKNEIKNRFNQADKDYERELEKNESG